MPRMTRKRVVKAAASWALALACASPALSALAAPQAQAPALPIGVWRGTSTCTDLKAAPACKDEVVIYELSPGEKPGTVHWKADKVVNGERGTMGELELAYDGGDSCWKAEFVSPKTHFVWCLKVDGSHMAGTGW